MPKITEIFAFVACDTGSDDEGIMTWYNPADQSWMPLLGADMKRVDSCIKLADEISKKTGQPYKIKRFKLIEDVIIRKNGNEPDCYKCVHRMTIAGDCHSRCNNHAAMVTGEQHGIDSGWFYWPINFDPVWLLTCDGFSDDPNDKMPIQTSRPSMALLNTLVNRHSH